MLVEENVLVDVLQKFFGFNKFKGDQEEIIKNVLSGNDTFVIMPTGGGKSMCYQLPALISEGTAIIISPLIALMKNQVDAIRGFSDEEGLAHFLNSSLNKSEIEQVKADIIAGKTKMLYVAPESLTKESNVKFLNDIQISFFAIDEAHCISEWGHDFRPEYRKLRPIMSKIGNKPIIALTATATQKVQMDIQKNLEMMDASVFKSSFNRPNLYYEVRPKVNVMKEIIKFIKTHSGKSGIVYCLSRKKVEEVAETLNINGIKALPYHAGLDSNTRGKNQDMFLMEDVEVIVATIAFGMGIDKPDIRFVIHHDIPKSLEGYYQETGRAGRDGLEGKCISFYSFKDIEKLEKFMKNKPVNEQEIGRQLLFEMAAYAESSVCRRKALLHYFGEEYQERKCIESGKCDNCVYPQNEVEGKDEVQLMLETVSEVKEKFNAKHIVNILVANDDQNISNNHHDEIEQYGAGDDHDEKFWRMVIRQSLLGGMLTKEIENYGLLKLSEKGRQFIKKPKSFKLVEERNFDELLLEDGSNEGTGGTTDPELFAMMKDLRKKIAKQKNLPPFVVFQDTSLEEMSIQYPINIDELKNISGVGMGKAMKFGKPFCDLIAKYVEENEIERPQDLVVKSVVNRSGLKVYIIQNIDKRRSLNEMAEAKKMSFSDLIREIESIVASGTKINLNYYLNDVIDEDRQQDVFDYFRSAETDSIQTAMEDLGENEFSEDEIRMMRIKFMSELGN